MSATSLAAIETLVRACDPRAGAAIRSVGSDATELLASLARDPSESVRESAALGLEVLCATVPETAPAPPSLHAALVHSLEDSYELVRRATVRSLARVGEPSALPALLALADRSTDAFERHAIARAVGARGLAPLDELRAREEAESDPWARRGWLLARARGGDLDARRAYVRLLASRTELQMHVTDYLPYLRGAWLAEGLLPWFDWREVVIFRGHGESPETLRACDCAVIVLVDCAGLSLAFPIVPPMHWSDAQLESARAIARRAIVR